MTTAANNGKREPSSLEATTVDLRDFTLGSALYLIQEGGRLVYNYRAPLTKAEAHRQAKAQAKRWGAPENPKTVQGWGPDALDEAVLGTSAALKAHGTSPDFDPKLGMTAAEGLEFVDAWERAADRLTAERAEDQGATVVDCTCKPGPIDISIPFGVYGATPELASYMGINRSELSALDTLPLARAHAFCSTCDGLGLVGDAANLYPVPCQFCDGTGLKARGDDHLDAYHDRAIAEYVRTERHGGVKVVDYSGLDTNVYGRRHDDFNADLRPGIVTAVLVMLTYSVFRWGGDLVRWVESWGWLS